MQRPNCLNFGGCLPLHYNWPKVKSLHVHNQPRYAYELVLAAESMITLFTYTRRAERGAEMISRCRQECASNAKTEIKRYAWPVVSWRIDWIHWKNKSDEPSCGDDNKQRWHHASLSWVKCRWEWAPNCLMAIESQPGQIRMSGMLIAEERQNQDRGYLFEGVNLIQ